jgi:hypothetical protein
MFVWVGSTNVSKLSDQRYREVDRRMERVEMGLERVADGLASSLQKTMVIGWVSVLAALATLFVRV